MTAGAPVRARDWVAGARPRTLGAGISPVVVGTAVGAAGHDVRLGRAALALVVAVAIQVGANYANDYSDGVRGTDADRVGPRRLTGSGAASPAAVRHAAVLAFAVAAVAGLVLSLLVDPWLLLLGAAAVAAAVLYTGGPTPYGYLGLGEVMVLAFFGFAATAGSAYVQRSTLPVGVWWASAICGLLAAAVLAVNNVRDRVSDAQAGKRTLAVRLGDRAARALCVGLVAAAFASVVALGTIHVGALLGLAALPLAVPPARAILGGRTGPALIPALVGLVRLELVVAALVALGVLLW